MLTSTVCRYEHFESDWYGRWAPMFGYPLPSSNASMHRKPWEFCAIAQALEERDMLKSGRSGLGFAVGREPLPSAFAARGCKILATDLAGDDPNWATQHAGCASDLWSGGLVSREAFESLVTFQFADMRDIQGIEREHYDFLWSSCSFEHLGSLGAGASFVVEAMSYLKPGGVAVHTTEFNVSSNQETVDQGVGVIYRKRDIEELDRQLRLIKCGIERVDYFPGTHRHDLNFDVPPYSSDPQQPHIKLLLWGHIATSILIIVHKGMSAAAPAREQEQEIGFRRRIANYLKR